jgi:UrcA family protein
MNRESFSRMSNRTRARLAVVAGCLFAAAMSGPGAALAADAADAAPSARVNYAGLDLTSEQGARILYQRIASAAERVCENPGTRDLESSFASHECKRKAISEAIEQVGNPRVAAILAARGHRS